MKDQHDVKFMDLTGQKYNRLTVLEYAGRDKYNRPLWKCKCDCGNIRIVNSHALRTGNTKSCGCLNIDRIKERNRVLKRTHGETNTKLFHVWSGIKTRCHNPHSINYHIYGQRGIKICDEWVNSYESFRDWAYENGYKEDLTIDRIDVNGNYEPSNCRWVTPKENNRNRRSNTLITFNGETHCIAEWADIVGIDYDVLQHRFKSKTYTVERALTEPQNQRGKYARKARG